MLSRRCTFTFVFLLTALGVMAQEKREISYSELPQAVVTTIKTEYIAKNRIIKCQIDNKDRYRIIVFLADSTREELTVLPNGKWLRKSNFIGMQGSDLTVLLQAQDLAGAVENVQFWTKTMFPDGTLEYRIFIKGRTYAWDVQKNYIGLVKNEMQPATPENLKTAQ